MTALFLGAGASFECGLPLVANFTNIIRDNVLKRLDNTYLFDFKNNNEFKEYFISLLKNPNLHYEQVILELENKQKSDNNVRDLSYSTRIQLIECIQILLLEIQNNIRDFMHLRFLCYRGILKLANQKTCLNVFSLNHDLVFEELCNFYDIDYKDGFHRNENHNYKKLGGFGVLNSDHLINSKFDFYDKNSSGINIIKLHGTLDIFACDDKRTYLKPRATASTNLLEQLNFIEKTSLELIHKYQTRPVNELFIEDDFGELQFFRRSLLTGGHKFSELFEQIAPREFLNQFTNKIYESDELVVIGYSFGDLHINKILKEWLEQPSKKMKIYDPYRKKLPDFLINLATKTEIFNQSISDYFYSLDQNPKSLELRNFLDLKLKNKG